MVSQTSPPLCFLILTEEEKRRSLTHPVNKIYRDCTQNIVISFNSVSHTNTLLLFLIIGVYWIQKHISDTTYIVLTCGTPPRDRGKNYNYKE